MAFVDYDEKWIELERYRVIQDTDRVTPREDFERTVFNRDKQNKLSIAFLERLEETQHYIDRAKAESTTEIREKERLIEDVELYYPERGAGLRGQIDKLTIQDLTRIKNLSRGPISQKARAALRALG